MLKQQDKQENPVTKMIGPGTTKAEQDLYTRIGGEQKLDNIVTYVYNSMKADKEIGKFFARFRLEKLKERTVDYLRGEWGGDPYKGSDLWIAHSHLGVKNQQYDIMMKYYVKALKKERIGKRESEECLASLEKMRFPTVDRDLKLKHLYLKHADTLAAKAGGDGWGKVAATPEEREEKEKQTRELMQKTQVEELKLQQQKLEAKAQAKAAPAAKAAAAPPAGEAAASAPKAKAKGKAKAKAVAEPDAAAGGTAASGEAASPVNASAQAGIEAAAAPKAKAKAKAKTKVAAASADAVATDAAAPDAAAPVAVVKPAAGKKAPKSADSEDSTKPSSGEVSCEVPSAQVSVKSKPKAKKNAEEPGEPGQSAPEVIETPKEEPPKIIPASFIFDPKSDCMPDEPLLSRPASALLTSRGFRIAVSI